jgi:predicted choloylglycine hydrolase
LLRDAVKALTGVSLPITRLATLLALTIRPAAGYDTLCTAPIGAQWAECGVNAAGLCLGTSSGHPQRSREDGRGIPQHMIPRLVLLNCGDVPEALAFLRGCSTIGKGINMVLVDAAGNGAGVEMTHTRCGVREPSRDAIFEANHPLAPEMQVFGAQADPDFINTRYFQNSLNRIVNLSARHDGEGERTVQGLKATLMDHHRPGAICQHPAENDARFRTHYAAILLAARREMWLNAGNPCLDHFEPYQLLSADTIGGNQAI